MTVFILGTEEQTQLRDLAKRANDNPIPIATIVEAAKSLDEGKPKYFLPDDQVIDLVMGWKVAYSREVHPELEIRHLSISSPDPEKVPLPQLCQMVMDVIGYTLPVEQCQISWEPLPNGGRAVNIIEPYRETVH